MSKSQLPPKRYIDADTGEYVYANQIIARHGRNEPFWKLYKSKFIALLRKYDGKQKEILLFIVDNIRQSDNTFKGTYNKIKKYTGASEPTIAKTMTSLQEEGFITLVEYGTWKISPEYLYYGNDEKFDKLDGEFSRLSEKRSGRKKKLEERHNG